MVVGVGSWVNHERSCCCRQPIRLVRWCQITVCLLLLARGRPAGARWAAPVSEDVNSSPARRGGLRRPHWPAGAALAAGPGAAWRWHGPASISTCRSIDPNPTPWQALRCLISSPPTSPPHHWAPHHPTPPTPPGRLQRRHLHRVAAVWAGRPAHPWLPPPPALGGGGGGAGRGGGRRRRPQAHPHPLC